MPILWFVKDGRRPYTQSGEGVPLSFEQVNSAFGDYAIEYVSTEPPEINRDSPSRHPVRVVIEVRDDEGTSAQFPKPGFYFIPLSVDEAQQLLSVHGAKR